MGVPKDRHHDALANALGEQESLGCVPGASAARTSVELSSFNALKRSVLRGGITSRRDPLGNEFRVPQTDGLCAAP